MNCNLFLIGEIGRVTTIPGLPYLFILVALLSIPTGLYRSIGISETVRKV